MGVDVHQEDLLPVIREFEEVACLPLYQVSKVFHILLRSTLVHVALHHVRSVVDVDMLVESMVFGMLMMKHHTRPIVFILVPLV